jgi:hypothetical protein
VIAVFAPGSSLPALARRPSTTRYERLRAALAATTRITNPTDQAFEDTT